MVFGYLLILSTCYAFASGLANNLVPILSSRPPPLVMLSRFRPREIPIYKQKNTPKAIFICIYAKIIVSLHPKAQRRGLEGGRCPPLGKPTCLTKTPVVAFKTY